MVAVKTARKLRREAEERRSLGLGVDSAMEKRERLEAQKRAAKQQRARQRRAQRRADESAARDGGVASAVVLYDKPLDEWDVEELAKGYPRRPDGSLPRRKPSYIPRSVHEEAISRFRDVAAADMRAIVPEAIETVRLLIENNDIDEKGRMVIPPSVKLEAAKWVVEHLVGKPRQPVDVDVSVKLQGILADVMVSPQELAARRNAEFIPAVGHDLTGDEE